MVSKYLNNLWDFEVLEKQIGFQIIEQLLGLQIIEQLVRLLIENILAVHSVFNSKAIIKLVCTPWLFCLLVVQIDIDKH